MKTHHKYYLSVISILVILSFCESYIQLIVCEDIKYDHFGSISNGVLRYGDIQTTNLYYRYKDGYRFSNDGSIRQFKLDVMISNDLRLHFFAGSLMPLRNNLNYSDLTSYDSKICEGNFRDNIISVLRCVDITTWPKINPPPAGRVIINNVCYQLNGGMSTYVSYGKPMICDDSTFKHLIDMVAIPVSGCNGLQDTQIYLVAIISSNYKIWTSSELDAF
jgi:hypothetical protein